MTDASARRINEHGVAVGDGGAPNGTGHPLRWRPPYTSADRLPKLGGSAWHSGAWAAGNNDRGDIVGSTMRGRLTPDKRDYGGVDARFHLPVTHVVAWAPQPRRLDEAGPMSHAFDVNNAGRAVGFADVDALQRTMAAYWSLDDGRVHVMGSPVPGTDRATAYGVSEGGWAAGATETFISDEELLFHAFVWTGSGELLMLPGAENAWDETDSIAHGVSDVRDEVTGRSAAGRRRPAHGVALRVPHRHCGRAGRVMTARTRCGALLLAARLLATPRGGPRTSQAAGDTIVVTTTIQAAVDAADPGDTVLVPGGDVRRDRQRHRARHHHPRLPRCGARRRRAGLQFGIRVRSLDGSRLDGFTLDGLTIRGYTRSGSQVSGVDNFRLTGTSYLDNPLYGLFPVRCSHGRVDHNYVSGSFDSGVYVGQCSDVVVDHNVAHDNTIGLEVELSTRIVVEDNVSTDNAIGALVQISPLRPVKVTQDVLVRRNVLSGNNRPNTITEGVPGRAARRRRDRQRRRRRRADHRQRGLRQPQRRGRSGEPACRGRWPSTRPSTPPRTAARCGATSPAATGSTPTHAWRRSREPTWSGT